MKNNKVIVLIALLLCSFSGLAENNSVDKALLEKSPEKSPENLSENQQAQQALHFQNIDELVALRAPGLALKYLQREQPVYNQQNPTPWLHWEQKHIALLKYMHQWQTLVQRVDEQIENLRSHKVATADRNWFLTEQLRALVELKHYQLALDKTRLLLWDASSLVNSNTLATWRRIIIQIYLNQGLSKDARTAMRRYQQDYGELQNEDGVSWLQVQAELLIQLQQYNDAIRLLQKITSSEAQALTLLAKLKANIVSPQEALDSAQLVLAGVKEEAENKGLFQYVALVAAVAAGENNQAISLLEILLTEQAHYLSDSLMQIGGLKIDADRLWDFYLQQGNDIANSKGLLKGNDTAWYTLASNLFQTEPLTAKTLFAVLSLQAQQITHRQLAMKQLVSVIESIEQPLELVNYLFTSSKYIPDINEVPAEVRYRLIDYNLSRGDVKAAAAIMSDLQQPPEEQPQFDWNLRRARVLILGGEFARGAQVLNEMLSAAALESTQVDKFLQVVFDLQAVEQFQLSLKLFNRLQGQVDDAHVLRELTFWKAESYHGLKQYDQAAYLFLKSALSPDNVYDPWYHTATFRAAESLMSAGLYEDARQRFFHLLKITENAARKTVIRQRLQAIQLKQQVN